MRDHRPKRETARDRAPGAARRRPHNAWTVRRAAEVRRAIEALPEGDDPVAVAGVALRGLAQSVRGGRLAALERGEARTVAALGRLLEAVLARGQKRRRLWERPQEARMIRPEQREGMA